MSLISLLALAPLLGCGDKDGSDSGDSGTPAAATTMAQAIGAGLPGSWSSVCVTWVEEPTGNNTHFVAFQPASSGVAETVTLSSHDTTGEDWDVHGMVWDGVGIVTSGDDGSVARIDLATGTIEHPSNDLVNVLRWHDRLLAERTDGTWAAYDSFEDAVAGSGGESVPELFDERFALGDTDYAYTTQPVADKFKVWHVPTGKFGELFVDGFEGYVWGLSIVGDRIHLLNDGRQEGTEDYNAWVYTFSTADGSLLGSLDLGVQGHLPRGLHCESLL